MICAGVEQVLLDTKTSASPERALANVKRYPGRLIMLRDRISVFARSDRPERCLP